MANLRSPAKKQIPNFSDLLMIIYTPFIARISKRFWLMVSTPLETYYSWDDYS